MDGLKLIWLYQVAFVVIAQDKIPVTMVTTEPFDASSYNRYPEYWCYVSSPDTNATVTSSRVVKTSGPNSSYDLPPPGPVRVMDGPYSANSAVYNVPLYSILVAFGVFSCDAVRAGRALTRVSNVIMHRFADTFPTDRLVTQTVNAGDTDQFILMSRRDDSHSDIRTWGRDENIITAGQDFSLSSDNQKINFIPEIRKDQHEGIYVPLHDGPQFSIYRGIQRLIVRSCPANRWAPPECYGVCDYCYNGGVCDDETGTCICSPGFMGPNCLEACGGNKFGPSCEFQCSYEVDSDDESCFGLQFCLVDPYGCRCNTGWRDLDCEKVCPSSSFGSSCLQFCNCDGICDRFTGACNGTCTTGWTGGNCQIPEVCPTGYYGANCTEKCYCKDDVDCDKTTGECPKRECGPTHMVLPGRMKCQECQGPFHGEACSQPCRCAEEDCDKVSGRCRGPCLAQWVDSFFCLAGLRAMSSSKFDPGTSTEVMCEIEVYGTSYNNLTVHLSRDPLSVNNSGIEPKSRTPARSTFTANVTDGEMLYCLMTNRDGDIVAITSSVASQYVLPVLSSPPTLITAGITHLSIQWIAWDEANDIGDPPIIRYITYYRSIGSSEWIRGSSTTSLTFVVTNLTTDVLYEFSVAAVREGINGEGPMSPEAQFRTICNGHAPCQKLYSLAVVPVVVVLLIVVVYIIVRWKRTSAIANSDTTTTQPAADAAGATSMTRGQTGTGLSRDSVFYYSTTVDFDEAGPKPAADAAGATRGQTGTGLSWDSVFYYSTTVDYDEARPKSATTQSMAYEVPNLGATNEQPLGNVTDVSNDDGYEKMGGAKRESTSDDPEGARERPSPTSAADVPIYLVLND